MDNKVKRKRSKPIIIKVDILRCKEWNLKKYFEMYSTKGQYKLLRGSPILINIEGHYVELNSIINAVRYKDKFIVNRYIMNIIAGNEPEYIKFKIRRYR